MIGLEKGEMTRIASQSVTNKNSEICMNENC